MNTISNRYARINIQIDKTDCTDETIQSWMDVLDAAVNWSTSNDYSIFHNKQLGVIGVSLSIGSVEQELLVAGTALGTIKSEVIMSELNFENLWFSIVDIDTDVISECD